MIFLSFFFGKAEMWMTLKIRCDFNQLFKIACIYQSVTHLFCSFCLVSLGDFILGSAELYPHNKNLLIKVFTVEAS